MAVEGQRDTKNAALMLSGRTLMDSKLWVIYRGSSFMELYRGSSYLGFLHNG
ncbi:hypothetical protein BHE74_00040384 [Ensete ventricosum]|nr:hypothetical protein BHE74_00040384 [Ensete ventricosum]